MGNKKITFISGVISGIIGVMVLLFTWLVALPIGSVGGEAITNYDILPYIKAYSGNAIKNYAKDKLFFEAIKSLNITVTDEEVEKEYKRYAEQYGGETELSNILLDTTQDIKMVKKSVKKSMLYQKALEHFATSQGSELALAKYNRFMEQIEKKNIIRVR